MNQKLDQLLLDATSSPDFRLTQKQLNEDFGAVGTALFEKKILIPTQSDLYVLCENCGQTHRVNLSNGSYYFNCENDENAGVQEVVKDDLLGYRFSVSNFATWLSQQMKTEGESVVTDSRRAWYLGSFESGGIQHHCYFSSLYSYDEVQNQQRRLSTSNAVVLWLDKNLHTENRALNNVINLFGLLDFQEGDLTFDYRLFKSHFDTKATTQPADIELDKDIFVTQRPNGRFLLIGANQDNTFEHDIRITPMMHNVLYHLFKIRFQHPNHKSSQELADAGLSKGKVGRKITESIKKINDIATKYHQKIIVVRLAENQYSLNPELDCMQPLHSPLH